MAPLCSISINLPSICNVRSSYCQILPAVSLPNWCPANHGYTSNKNWLATKERPSNTAQMRGKICGRKVWCRMEHQNMHFSPERRVGQWAPWFSTVRVITWVSRSKIADANNCRLRASSLVVSHAPRKCISKNRTSPVRIIKRIVYSCFRNNIGPGNCRKRMKKAKQEQDSPRPSVHLSPQEQQPNNKPWEPIANLSPPSGGQAQPEKQSQPVTHRHIERQGNNKDKAAKNSKDSRSIHIRSKLITTYQPQHKTLYYRRYIDDIYIYIYI